MIAFMRRVAPILAAFAGVVLFAGCARAETKWPSLMRYTLALSTSDTARYQTSLGFSGPITDKVGAKVEGWWIAGTGKDRAFVGDAYVDYTQKPLYIAAGRKYVMFGPIGVLVSPGISGAQVKLDGDRWEVQGLAGTIAFTPGTGTERFNFFGTRSPSDEHMTALRAAARLTDPGAQVPIRLGVNWLRVVDDTGTSVDAEVGVTKTLTLFGEAASFNSDANAYGVRFSDAQTRKDEKVWILVLYRRSVDVGFTPAIVGASAFFENQHGWAGGLYHQLNKRDAIGVFTDKNDAIFTWFGSIPL